MPIRGIIFDLDGTLVDSALDFDLMRQEMGIAPGLPLLEALAQLPPAEQQRCQQILWDHEHRGGQRAQLFPGVQDFLARLKRHGVGRAILTRNSRATTLATLARLALEFDPVVSRDDGPVKPDPEAVWQICKHWNIRPQECLLIGDYRYDIECGHRAGVRTVLFSPDGGRGGLEDHEHPDFVLQSFAKTAQLWDWISQIDLGGSPATC